MFNSVVFQGFEKSLVALFRLLPQLSYILSSRKSFTFGDGFPSPLELNPLPMEYASKLLSTRWPSFENKEAEQVANTCNCNAFLLDVISGLITSKRCSIKVGFRY